jgi:hypothetical protein
MKLRYIGKHLPKGIIEVKNKEVESLLNTGNYELVNKVKKAVNKKKKTKPNLKEIEEKLNDNWD